MPSRSSRREGYSVHPRSERGTRSNSAWATGKNEVFRDQKRQDRRHWHVFDLLSWHAGPDALLLSALSHATVWLGDESGGVRIVRLNLGPNSHFRAQQSDSTSYR